MWHFSTKKDGVMPCGAKTPDKCDYKDQPHFATEQEAKQAWHETKQITHGLFANASSRNRRKTPTHSISGTHGKDLAAKAQGADTQNQHSDRDAQHELDCNDRRVQALTSMTPDEARRYISSSPTREEIAANIVGSRISELGVKVGHVKRAATNGHCDTETLRSYAESIQGDVDDTVSLTEALMFSKSGN